MSRKKVLIGVVALIAALSCWAYFYSQTSSTTQTEVAKAAFESDYELKPSGELRFKKVQGLQKIHNGDTLKTPSRGEVKVQFPTGFELELSPDTLVVFEIMGEALPSKTLLTFLRGNYKLLRAGQEGTLIVSIDDIRQDPLGLPAPAVAMQITPAMEPTTPPQPENTEAPAADLKPTTNESNTSKLASALPQDYIVKVISNQKTYFGRCYADYIQKVPQGNGKIDLSFMISQNGTVSNIKVFNNSFNDKTIETCTTEIISRIQFKQFTGDPIIVNFPILFD